MPVASIPRATRIVTSMLLRSSVLSLLFLSGLGSVAAAQSCNAYLFPQDLAAVRLAKVQQPRAALLRDDEGCPAAGLSCAGKAYLVAGDQVLVGGASGNYLCIAFFNGHVQSTGWIESKSLATLPVPAVQGDLAGTWKRQQGDAVLKVHKSGASYTVEAMATYAVRRDNVRTGTAAGRLTITTSTSGITVASFTDTSGESTCRVQLRQLGAWILVNDGASEEANSPCGGMGVTFNGIYRRARQ